MNYPEPDWTTAAEMAAQFLHERSHPRNRWGRWRVNRRLNTLDFHDDLRGKIYEIDLDTMTTAASCLDWIFQVSQKTWMTDKDRGDLLRAIEDTVYPQGTLCSWGINKARARA